MGKARLRLTAVQNIPQKRAECDGGLLQRRLSRVIPFPCKGMAEITRDAACYPQSILDARRVKVGKQTQPPARIDLEVKAVYFFSTKRSMGIGASHLVCSFPLIYSEAQEALNAIRLMPNIGFPIQVASFP